MAATITQINRTAFMPPQAKAVASGSSPFGLFGGMQTSRRGVDRIFAAYSTSPMLRHVFDRIAWIVASQTLRLYRTTVEERRRVRRNLAAMYGRGRTGFYEVRDYIKSLIDAKTLTEIEAHPAIELFDSPISTKRREHMSGTAFRQVVQLMLDLGGEAFIMRSEALDNPQQTPSGLPKELFPLPPHWVHDAPKGDGYEVRSPASIFRTAKLSNVSPELIHWMRYVDPANPYGRGSGLALTLADEIDIDEFSAQYASSILSSRGLPAFFAYIKGLQDDQAKRMEVDWLGKYTGPRKAGAVMFTGREIEITEAGKSPADLQVDETRKSTWERARHTAGIPPEVLGVLFDSNRSTVREAKSITAEYVTMPRLIVWQDWLNNVLLPTADDSTRLLAIFDSPIPADKEFEQEYAEQAPFALRMDEWRERIGLEPYGGDLGDMVFVPSKMQIVAMKDLLEVAGGGFLDTGTDDDTGNDDDVDEDDNDGDED